MNTICTDFIAVDQFQQLLFNWFDVYGRKNLPWQINKDPYRVHVSEVMLQQTQVATVIPYFLRFMANFPDVDTLARSPLDAVLHLWAGLGYYRRAHHLHQAARMVMQEFGGCFPQELDLLRHLPGVGLTTASAIRSLAFNLPAVILDGNVKRFLSRLHGIDTSVQLKATENSLWQIARCYASTNRPADYTQAMMDIGALICTPKSPLCHGCPFLQECYAARHGLQAQLPMKAEKKTLPIKDATFLVLQVKEKIFMKKRVGETIWSGLWSLPEFVGKPQKKHLQHFCASELSKAPLDYQYLSAIRHTFTHFHLNLYPVVIRISRQSHLRKQAGIWYNLAKPQALGLPKPIKTIVEKLL